MIIQDLRYLIRSSSLAGLVPYVSNSSSFNFKNTPVNQINPGELFFNQEDKKLWIAYQDASNNLGTILLYPQSITGSPTTDVFVTGGTYNPATGIAIFTNNTGGTFNVSGFLTGGTSGLTSVGLTMPSAFNVSGSPLTTNGTINVGANGLISQYIRGDGTLGVFPAIGGGGGGTVYYLNGNISQGTISGISMYQLSKVANTGAAANFSRNTVGTLATFITDVGQPSKLLIPPGIWIVEAYLTASSAGGNPPEIQAVVEKWDGTNITVISSGPVEQLTNGSTKDLYQFAASIPSGTTLSLTDRIVIQLVVSNPHGKTVTLYTENGNISSVITTFSNGISSLNGLTDTSQFFATSVDNNTFTITSSGDTHTFNLPRDIRVTGATYSNNTFTYTNNTGGTFNVNFNSVTGLTSTGTISSSVISATTYQGFATAIYPTGTVQGFLQTHTYPGNSSSGHGPNTMRGYYITIEDDVTIDTIYCRATATNATARITYAIYDLTSTGYPNTKLFNSTEFTFAVGTVQTQAVSLTLSAGTYVVVSILNSASGTMVGVGRQNMYNTGIGTLDFTAAGAFFLPQGYTVSQTYSTTLPTTFTAGATATGTAALPALWFKVT